MKHVSFHYTDEDNKRDLRSTDKDWVTAPRCYKDAIEMICFQSKVDSFPSLKLVDVDSTSVALEPGV